MENWITEVDILDEAKDCFLTYSEEVLTDRAIPNAEDGLLSAQRKILWTMEDYLKMTNKSKTKKCNSLVGSTLMTSYFHGDASCYGVLYKMAQDYLMRYPLIQGQGALGTQEDNSMVASSRYTEAKPSKYADLMFNSFKKNVVPMKETYNGEFMEPIILPALFPNALVNGREAIGISMSHNSLPANLSEVCDGIIAYIQANGEINTQELMKYILGPDFPLGGTIINQKDIYAAYDTGKSAISLKVRGDYEIKDRVITFTSIPYRTYRNKIKEDINKNIEILEKFIEDFDDESSIGNNKLVFTIKKGIDVNSALETIFKLTDLQTTLSYNMNFIINGTPQLCSLKTLIKAYVDHQTNVLLNATKFDKEKAEARIHILVGLLAAIDKINEVIELIKQSANKDDARNKLINFLSIDEVQANAILDMKLSRLTRIDKNELIDEKRKNEEIVAECLKIINDKDHRDNVLIEQIKNLKKNYGDERRTKLINYTIPKEEKETVYVEPEKCVVVMTEGGTIKRIPTTSFRTQKRNGKGVKSQDDITSCVLRTNTVDSLMIFSNKGLMYRLLVNNIPVGTNASLGTSIKLLTKMSADEQPSTMYSIYKDTQAEYVLFITKNGLIKKTALSEYINTKKSGLIATHFRDGDSLASVSLIKNEDVLILTKNGMAIHIATEDLSSASRVSTGVKAITLKEGDEVVAALPIRDTNDTLAVFSYCGLGKKIPLSEYPVQKRGGKGSSVYKVDSAEKCIIGGTLVSDDDNILIIGEKTSICISAKDIPIGTRGGLGNALINTGNVKSITKI